MALAPVEHGGVGPYWSALRAHHLVFTTLCDPTNETHIRTHQKRLRRDGGRPKQGGHQSCIQTHIQIYGGHVTARKLHTTTWCIFRQSPFSSFKKSSTLPMRSLPRPDVGARRMKESLRQTTYRKCGEPWLLHSPPAPMLAHLNGLRHIAISCRSSWPVVRELSATASKNMLA